MYGKAYNLIPRQRADARPNQQGLFQKYSRQNIAGLISCR
jgi:hypothetical protein